MLSPGSTESSELLNIEGDRHMSLVLSFQLRSEQPTADLTWIEEALRRQLNGIRLDQAAVGTVFSVSRPSGEAIKVPLIAISAPGTVDQGTTISWASAGSPRDTVPGIIAGNNVATVPSPIIDGLQQYISATSVALADDDAGFRMAESDLGRLRGIPAFDVAGDIMTRLRGIAWLREWGHRKHGTAALRGLRTIEESTSLILLCGDPGTGKSAVMRQMAPVCARGLRKNVMFVQLNERLRGQGIQGRAGSELISAVETIAAVAESYALPTIVFLDEADAVASSRGTDDIGSGAQENVAIVDGLIVALDRVARRTQARVVFVMATNLADRIDPAIVRRASVYSFDRPDAAARRQILDDLLGDVLGPVDMDRVAVALTRDGLPVTAADIANQVVAKAIREAAINDRPVLPSASSSLPPPRCPVRPYTYG
jgi:hypothetical protein